MPAVAATRVGPNQGFIKADSATIASESKQCARDLSCRILTPQSSFAIELPADSREHIDRDRANLRRGRASPSTDALPSSPITLSCSRIEHDLAAQGSAAAQRVVFLKLMGGYRFTERERLADLRMPAPLLEQ